MIDVDTDTYIYVNLNDVSVCFQLYLSTAVRHVISVTSHLPPVSGGYLHDYQATTEMCFLNYEYLSIIINNPHHYSSFIII